MSLKLKIISFKLTKELRLYVLLVFWVLTYQLPLEKHLLLVTVSLKLSTLISMLEDQELVLLVQHDQIC